MIVQIIGENVPDAFTEAKWMLRTYGVEEDSRNGPVLTIPSPVLLEIKRPWERVLFDPIRDANPFFHVMEFVWMMAGSNDAEWISQFNKRMMEYADGGILRGAYGWRWAQPENQITHVIRLLREQPGTRQAVLSMWRPEMDGPQARSSDRPCNTHIYFRTHGNRLDMTVCNRSNDLFWGMLGSNVVHFTMLHELVALATGMEQGRYRVFTNNLHAYMDMPRFSENTYSVGVFDPYRYDEVRTQPLLEKGESYEEFMADAYTMVEDGFDFDWNTQWFKDVAGPMYDAYLDKQNRNYFINCIGAPDWFKVCSEWNTRRKS
jgi:hypothetical protein